MVQRYEQMRRLQWYKCGAAYGMWLGACRLFLFYIAKVIKISNIIVVLNKNYIFFDMEE